MVSPMSKTPINKYDDVLDEQTLQYLSEAPAVLRTMQAKVDKLRNRVWDRIDQDTAETSDSFITVRDKEGPWIEIAPMIKKKVLYENPDTGIESYLLRAEAGASAPPHSHEFDEHCLVLEGDISFDQLCLKAGDYHFAPAGSEHGEARTDNGVLVFIQTRQAGTPAVF